MTVLQDPRQKEDRRRMDYSQRLQCEHTYTADRGQDYRMKLNRSVQIVALCRQFIFAVYV